MECCQRELRSGLFHTPLHFALLALRWDDALFKYFVCLSTALETEFGASLSLPWPGLTTCRGPTPRHLVLDLLFLPSDTPRVLGVHAIGFVQGL